MQAENHNEVDLDAQAVAAVRGGDLEAFRVLVERHERRVFAVAWSRLGDPALAEEATQEAFIRAFRRIQLLRDGAKFGAWIAALARRVALNLALRHRRELRKRERWALEQVTSPAATEDRPGEPLTPETLRAALEQLPARHRECLALFYLERRSGWEAAAALGIAESAFRVRLHRARGALREELEAQLARSLERLGPVRPLAPTILAALAVSATAQGAAVGGGIASGVAKGLSPFGKGALGSALAGLVALAAALPGVVSAAWLGYLERANFREADGFRARLHRQFCHSYIWGFPVLFLGILALTASTRGVWGPRDSDLIVLGLCGALLAWAARSLVVLGQPRHWLSFAVALLFLVPVAGREWGWLPERFSSVPVALAAWLLVPMVGRRQARMDYSLFLRAAQGLLGGGGRPGGSGGAVDRRALLAFARFLGGRGLVCGHLWTVAGLRLRLPPVRARFLSAWLWAFVPPVRRWGSSLVLGWNGQVAAKCGRGDLDDLAALPGDSGATALDLERGVAAAVSAAWADFRAGRLEEAERRLGQTPESEIFRVPLVRAKSTRWGQLLIGSLACSLLVLTLLPILFPIWLSDLRPVLVPEPAVRAFLNGLATNPPPSRRWYVDLEGGLSTCIALPSVDLWTPEARSALRQRLIQVGGRASAGGVVSPRDLGGSFVLQRAMIEGWLSWDDAAFSPTAAKDALVRGDAAEPVLPWRQFLNTGEYRSGEGEALRIDVLQLRGWVTLRWLRGLDALAGVDREPLIRHLLSGQLLSGDAVPGRPAIAGWREWRGLFVHPLNSPLQDTYYHVAALELLGGLQRMDREACVRGLLRRHRGAGYFDSPRAGHAQGIHIEGNARDTLCAFEALRLLGAVDRVTDLPDWQFRERKGDSTQLGSSTSWARVEAWVCQRRWERMLRERRERPHAPVRSLLDPSAGADPTTGTSDPGDDHGWSPASREGGQPPSPGIRDAVMPVVQAPAVAALKS